MIPTPHFWQTTRGRLVALLRHAEHTVNELAHKLELTDNAVRAHLVTLDRDGLVRQSGQRPGTRRPNYTYQLTSEAEQLFPKAYAPVLRGVLDVLYQQLPQATRQQVLKQVGGQLAQPHVQELSQLPLPDRLVRVGQLLQSMGAQTHITNDADTIRIQGTACPLAKVVQGSDDPAACTIMQAMLEAMLGIPVAEQCQRVESPRCCFTLTSPGLGSE